MISYTYSTHQFVLSTFQVLNGHMWLAVTVLDSTGIEDPAG